MDLNKYDLQGTMDYFDTIIEQLIKDGGHVEYSKSKDSELLEVSFKILDDTYLMHRSIDNYGNNKYYGLMYFFPFPYKRIDYELHAFPFEPGGEFDHCNITYKWDCANPDNNRNVSIDIPRFQDELESFSETIKRFKDVKKFQESEEYLMD